MGSRDVLLEFREPSISPEGDPLHIFGTCAAENMEFGMHIDHEGRGEARNFKFSTVNVGHVRHEREKCKTRSNEVGRNSRDILLEFWDPFLSREWLKLETSKTFIKAYRSSIEITYRWINSCNKTANIKCTKLHSVSQSYVRNRSKTAKIKIL